MLTYNYMASAKVRALRGLPPLRPEDQTNPQCLIPCFGILEPCNFHTFAL